jgi:outer membrane lipoprotein-sorting protein
MDGQGACESAPCAAMKARFLVRLWLALLASGPVWLQAGMGDELAATHLERMGGLEKIRAVAAMRAEGRTFIEDKTVEVVMWAQRPNRLRIESRMEGRKFVQVYDGEHPPWQSHSAVEEGAPRPMRENEAREFIRNADFDGPLISYGEKGYTVDYAGEEKVEGRPAYKLLVMSRRDEILFVWLDKESYLLTKRLEYRINQGRRAGIETFYKDYRTVKGVPQPFRIETRSGGRALNVILIDKMEPNPRLPRGVYEFPAALAEKGKLEESGKEKAAVVLTLPTKDTTDEATKKKPDAGRTAESKTAEEAGEKSAAAKAVETGREPSGANGPEQTAEKSGESTKRGFFRRLFGGDKPDAEPKPDVSAEGEKQEAGEAGKSGEAKSAGTAAKKDESKPADAKPDPEQREKKPEPKP